MNFVSHDYSLMYISTLLSNYIILLDGACDIIVICHIILKLFAISYFLPGIELASVSSVGFIVTSRSMMTIAQSNLILFSFRDKDT